MLVFSSPTIVPPFYFPTPFGDNILVLFWQPPTTQKNRLPDTGKTAFLKRFPKWKQQWKPAILLQIIVLYNRKRPPDVGKPLSTHTMARVHPLTSTVGLIRVPHRAFQKKLSVLLAVSWKSHKPGSWNRFIHCSIRKCLRSRVVKYIIRWTFKVKVTSASLVWNGWMVGWNLMHEVSPATGSN